MREPWVEPRGPGGFPLFSLLDISDSLRFADTFVQSTIHNLDLTSASGLGELSLKPNTLLEASNDLRKEDCLFLNIGTLTRHSPPEKKNSSGDHFVSFQRELERDMIARGC